MVLVRKFAAQMRLFVSFEYYAPGEQRRSGLAPRTQPLVFVRSLSSTVFPTSTPRITSAKVGTAATPTTSRRSPRSPRP
jgi:hypothetical protein